MFSKFFVLSSRGDSIISRDFRGEGRTIREESAEFFKRITDEASDGEMEPIFCMEGVSYCHVRSCGLYFVATMNRRNVSATLALEMLDRLCRLFKDYCGDLNEESIRKNFVLIYELLDEALDFGVAQNTRSELLKGYVHSEVVLAKRGGAVGELAEKLEDIVSPALAINKKTKSSSATSRPIAVSFSKDRSQKNELFVDLLERVTVVIGATGSVVKAEIDGCVLMKSYLKGEPTLQLALNEEIGVRGAAGDGSASSSSAISHSAIVFEDVNFHHLVGPQQFARTKQLTFSPPDGEFIVFNYRISDSFKLPFRVFPFIEEAANASQIDITVKIRADLPIDKRANDFRVFVPVPAATASVSSELGYTATSEGERGEFHKQRGLYIWTIPQFHGGTEHILRAHINLAEPRGPGTLREIGPISLDFEIPMHTCSGVTIKYLKVTERGESYDPYRWVRMISQSRSYVCRPN
jgi:AP-4 complex subunit mu-1